MKPTPMSAQSPHTVSCPVNESWKCYTTLFFKHRVRDCGSCPQPNPDGPSPWCSSFSRPYIPFPSSTVNLSGDDHLDLSSEWSSSSVLQGEWSNGQSVIHRWAQCTSNIHSAVQSTCKFRILPITGAGTSMAKENKKEMKQKKSSPKRSKKQKPISSSLVWENTAKLSLPLFAQIPLRKQ